MELVIVSQPILSLAHLQSCSSFGVLRPVRVRGEGHPRHLRPPLHDGLPDDHQGESPAHGEDAAHQ